MLYQQGDVLMEKVEEVPEGASEVQREGARLILAEGEATGHAHAVTDTTATLYAVDEVHYLDAPKGVTVKHEEHHQVKLPAGKWRIRKVKEYDHFAEEAREVRD